MFGGAFKSQKYRSVSRGIILWDGLCKEFISLLLIRRHFKTSYISPSRSNTKIFFPYLFFIQINFWFFLSSFDVSAIKLTSLQMYLLFCKRWYIYTHLPFLYYPHPLGSPENWAATTQGIRGRAILPGKALPKIFSLLVSFKCFPISILVLTLSRIFPQCYWHYTYYIYPILSFSQFHITFFHKASEGNFVDIIFQAKLTPFVPLTFLGMVPHFLQNATCIQMPFKLFSSMLDFFHELKCS